MFSLTRRILLLFLAFSITGIAAICLLASRRLDHGPDLWGFLFQAAMVIGILAPLFLLALARATRPLRSLAGQARRVQEGDFSRGLDMDVPSELADLAWSVNELSVRLRRRLSEDASLQLRIRELFAARDLPSVCRLGIRLFYERLPFRYGGVFRLEDGLVITEYFIDLKSDAEGDPRPLLSDPLVREMMDARKPLVHRPGAGSGHRTAIPGSEILAVPLFQGEDLAGFVSLSDPQVGEEFDPAEFGRVEFIAAGIQAAIQSLQAAEQRIKSRLLEQELQTAEVVQRTLFPRGDLLLEDFATAGYYASAFRTSGDWYGHIRDDRKRRVVLMIGDVTGSGVASALLASAANSFIKTIDQVKETFYDLELMMRQFQKEIETISGREIPSVDFDPLRPEKLLEYLNENINRTVEGQLVMTFFVGSFDLASRVLSFAGAGHEAPLVYRRGGSVRADALGRRRKVECLVSPGVCLGAVKSPRFSPGSTSLEPGDAVLLYTDGLIECRSPSGQEFGDRRLVRLLEEIGDESAAGIRDRILAEVEKFRSDRPLEDDVSFLVAKAIGGAG